MKALANADQQIGKYEMMIHISSAIIGVGILTFPRAVAKATGSFDGWMSVVIGGVVSCLPSFLK